MAKQTDQNDSGHRRRVLMLTNRLPYPPDRGDRIRSYHILRTLCDHFDMAVACTSFEPVWLQHHQLLATMAQRVAILPIREQWSRLQGARALLSGAAITPAWYFRIALGEQILQWHEQQPFDAVLTFCSGMIRYARLLTDPTGRAARLPVPRHVIDLVDVDSAKWLDYAENSWAPLRWLYRTEAKRLRRIEAGRHDRFDAITVTTRAEAEIFRQHVGDHMEPAVVSNGVDLEYFEPQQDKDAKTLLFVGVLDYKPNVDGIAWFVEHVMPRLRQAEPEANLKIVGRQPTQRVLDLDGRPGVEVIGSVPDVRYYLRKASVVIAPLRIARGVQNKVLEAMASSRATVCTAGAARGIDATVGEHLLVADEPDQWVEQIRRLFNDGSLRRGIASAARNLVEQRYDWVSCLQPMVRLLGDDRENLSPA